MRCALEVACERKAYLEKIAEEKRLQELENLRKKEQAYLEYRPQLDKEIEHQLVTTGEAIIILQDNGDTVFYGIPKPMKYSNGKIYNYHCSQTEIINLAEYVEYLHSLCYNVKIGTSIRYVYSRSKADSADSKRELTKIVITLDSNYIK